MKKLITLLLIAMFYYSCNTNDDIVIEPDPSENFQIEDLDNLLILIQENLPEFVESAGTVSSALTRINYMFGGSGGGGGFDTGTYIDSYIPERYSNTIIWETAYNNLLPNINEAITVAEEQGFNKHLGIAKIIKAYTLKSLVDMYGAISYTQEDGSISVLDGAAVYSIVETLLDESIINLVENGDALATDYYYNNDFDKWIKLANTLKMTVYVNTRLVDDTAISKFNNIVASNNFISSNADDFEFRYGQGSLEYLAKHPSYSADYTTYGAGTYRSNWLMDRMQKDNDPRIRYYFYRQTSCIFGNLNLEGALCDDPYGEPIIMCLPEEKPNHYTEEMPFCSLEKGYWGRDHGNHNGIPPDAYRRSVIGVYPAAGLFDGNNFAPLEVNVGGQGLGVTPIMLGSWVDFMRGEIALTQNNASEANSFLIEGMQKSIVKVVGFGPLDPEADADYFPTSTETTNFIAFVSEEFINANINDQWDIFARQQFVAHYGNGLDSYNMYRRTGYPYTLQYFSNSDPGAFTRSLLYPNTALDGGLITQKPNVGVQVFWDTNNAYPSFPYSN